jgi:DNA processing protein
VVSGLALGIDGAAHQGVLDAGGSPIGVVASGLDVVYPSRHRRLWSAVGERGLLLTEVPYGTRPTEWRFPQRNRIIAGLADLVVVVESHVAGGSLHTVREAEARGVDVMAVPGSVRNPAAAGTNQLLSEGCAPARDTGDVLVALGLGAGRRGAANVDRRAVPGAAGAAVLEAFDWEPTTLDQLAIRTGLPLPDLALTLEGLRADGWIQADGPWFQRVAQ